VRDLRDRFDHRPRDRRPADGFFRADAVERVIDDPSSRREDLSRRLSGLLAFTLWYEHHVERTPTTPSNGLLQGVLA
jgi:hypothetical protein